MLFCADQTRCVEVVLDCIRSYRHRFLYKACMFATLYRLGIMSLFPHRSTNEWSAVLFEYYRSYVLIHKTAAIRRLFSFHQTRISFYSQCVGVGSSRCFRFFAGYPSLDSISSKARPLRLKSCIQILSSYSLFYQTFFLQTIIL